MKYKKQIAALLAAMMLSQGIPTNVLQPTKIVASEQMTTIADSLYQDDTFTTIKTTVTQKQIDQLMSQAETIEDMSVKTVTMVRLNEAMNQLQELCFTGYSNRHFATLAYYSESKIAKYQTFAITPHSGIKDLYLSIEIQNEKGEQIFKREIKGTDALKNETIEIPMQEGYYVNIYKCEPGRFYTNHDDVLKHDSSNPFQYKVMNGKLARLHEGNRRIIFSQNEQVYAQIKVDYHANKLYIDQYEGIHLNHDTTVVLKGYEEEVKSEIAFKQGTTTTNLSDEVAFYPNQTLELKVGDQIQVVNDDGNQQAMNISDGSKIILQRNGIYAQSNVDMQVYKDVLFTKIPLETFQQFDQSFRNWFLQQPQAMKYYLEAGNASNVQLHTMLHFGYDNIPFVLENEIKALQILEDIYQIDGKNLKGMKLKMAIAVSKEFASGVQAWMGGSLIDPVERYQLYAKSYDDGIFFEDFGALSTADLRNVVVCQITNEDILWLRNHIETNHPEMLERQKIVGGHSLLVYREKNPDTNESIHGPNFYGPNPTIKEVIKYGGVCGTMSKFSVVLAQAYGIPAQAVGQPGHCAYQYLNPKGEYNLGYDVYGWEKCGNYHTTFPYLKINAVLNQNRSRFEESEYYRMKAMLATNEQDKIGCIVKAVNMEPLNYLAWEDYLSYCVNGSMEYQILCGKIEKALKDYPVIIENITGKQVKTDIMNLFNEEGCLKDHVTLDSLNTLQNKFDQLIDGSYKKGYQDILDRAKNSIKQFKLTGISHRQVVLVNVYEDGSDRVKVDISAGQPHYGFNEPYIEVTLTNENNEVVYHKTIKGVDTLSASSEVFVLKDGSQMEFQLKEAFRIHADNESLLVHENGLYRYVKENGNFIVK